MQHRRAPTRAPGASGSCAAGDMTQSRLIQALLRGGVPESDAVFRPPGVAFGSSVPTSMAARLPTPYRHRNLTFPPLVLQGDPLAASLIAREKGALTEDTLRAAIILNATRIATIVRSWFPLDEVSAPRVCLGDFLDVLSALDLRSADDEEAGIKLFTNKLDRGDGTTSVRELLDYILGPHAARTRPAPSQPRGKNNAQRTRRLVYDVRLPPLRAPVFNQGAAVTAVKTRESVKRSDGDGASGSGGDVMMHCQARKSVRVNFGPDHSSQSRMSGPRPSASAVLGNCVECKGVPSSVSEPSLGSRQQGIQMRSRQPPPVGSQPRQVQVHADQSNRGGAGDSSAQRVEETPLEPMLDVDVVNADGGVIKLLTTIRYAAPGPTSAAACTAETAAAHAAPVRATSVRVQAPGGTVPVRTPAALPAPVLSTGARSAIAPQVESHLATSRRYTFSRASRTCTQPLSKRPCATASSCSSLSEPKLKPSMPSTISVSAHTRRGDAIRQAELLSSNAPTEAPSPPPQEEEPASLWSAAGLRSKIKMLGALADSAQREKATEATMVATEAELMKLLEDTSAKVCLCTNSSALSLLAIPSRDSSSRAPSVPQPHIGHR
jgi:hypothetical protein